MLTPFKGRSIDLNKPVRVYRNLTSKTLSIRQGSKVVAHSDIVYLSQVRFIVNERGHQRVLEEKQKNVHAFAFGFLMFGEFHTETFDTLISYDPYKMNRFYTVEEMKPVIKADAVMIQSDGKIYGRGVKYV